jgi:hypothetical protein
MMSEQMTQGLSFADVINSQSINNTSVNSLGVDMSKFKRVLYVIANGGLGAAGVLQAQLQSCFESNFAASVHNITQSVITNINTNNVFTTIEVRADQVNQQNQGDRYVRLNITGSGNAITVLAFGIGGEAEQKPASQYNLNTTYLQAGLVVNT